MVAWGKGTQDGGVVPGRIGGIVLGRDPANTTGVDCLCEACFELLRLYPVTGGTYGSKGSVREMGICKS